MSMSTHIVGFKPPDEKWKAMKAIWEACERGHVPLPREVIDFFAGNPPDDAGVEVPLDKHACVSPHKSEGQNGYEVDVTALPKDVTIIRFFNSW
jgi:hypothetical protein